MAIEGSVTYLADPLLEEELEVMQLIVEGLKDSSIARRLDVSVVTVRRRAQRFRKRVGAETRGQAIAIAASKGWLDVQKGLSARSITNRGESLAESASDHEETFAAGRTTLKDI